ncbi:MAG TPA: hypothetical protein VN963_06190, partial [bacterium]|nr:hypothetical protein [bacterium]
MTFQKWMALIVIVLIGVSIMGILPTDLDRKDKKMTSLKLGLDIQGGLHMNLVVDRDKMQGKSEQEISDAADRALEILRNRIDALGVSEPVLEREGTDGIVIQLPGLTDIKHARDIILSTAQLEFRLVSNLRESDYLDKDGKIDVKKLPQGITYFPGKENQDYLCEKVLLTGEALVDASVETDSLG